jgi:hypothetical protein
VAVGSVLAHLNGKDLRLAHLLVEELHYPQQFVRDDIGDKDQPQPPRTKVGLDMCEEVLDRLSYITAEVRDRLSGSAPAAACVASNAAQRPAAGQ